MRRDDGGGSPLSRARALALRLLAARARTTAQIRDRLTRAGCADVADDVIAWLAGLRYVDDAAYARARARSLLSLGRAGPRLAERRLVSAGIQLEDARAAVAAATDEVASERHADARGGCSSEVALCRAAALRRTGGAPPRSLEERDRARLARFLLGRGFSGSAVAAVVGAGFDDG